MTSARSLKYLLCDPLQNVSTFVLDYHVIFFLSTFGALFKTHSLSGGLDISPNIRKHDLCMLEDFTGSRGIQG